MVTAVPIVAVVLLLSWLPDLLRPGVSRARIRTARVTAGPVDAMIMASGTVVPEIERVLSSPVDARVLRILKRPGARVERGDAIVELDTSESVLALDKLRSDLQVKQNEQAERRLALKTSLADIDGRIAVKQLEVESAEARVAGDRTLVGEGLLSRDAFRRSELALTQARRGLEWALDVGVAAAEVNMDAINALIDELDPPVEAFTTGSGWLTPDEVLPAKRLEGEFPWR